MSCTKRSHFTAWPACTWCFAQSDLILPHDQPVLDVLHKAISFYHMTSLYLMFCTKRSHFTAWPACTWCFAQSDLILPHDQQVQVDVRATGCFTLRYAFSCDERIISQTCIKQHVDVLYNLCLLVYWMQLAILLTSSKLDNMSWFSHRRSPSPPGGHAMVSSVAACCIWPNYGACPTMHCQWGWLRGFSFFVPDDLDLWPWPWNSGEIFVQST